jgi:hypothetical protein
MRRIALIGIVLAALSGGCSKKDDAQAKREDEFRQMLTGARLTGKFSVTGRDEVRADSYKISSVTKLAGGIWTINAEIPRKNGPVTMPVPVRMEWAGDTAVMKLTDATLPGLGTFTVRILFYKASDGKAHYAGFWSGGDHGGEMFGVVEN